MARLRWRAVVLAAGMLLAGACLPAPTPADPPAFTWLPAATPTHVSSAAPLATATAADPTQTPAAPSATRTARPRPMPTASPTDEPARRVPIIEYHYATFNMSPEVQMRPEWLEGQLRWLADNHFHTLTSSELAAFVRQGGAPARSVALTFDVGWTHFDEYSRLIVPALRRHGLRAIFFVLPSRISETCDGLTTCWPLLLAWQKEGLISIESHSMYHLDYTTLPPESIEQDAAKSKAVIEAHTGRPVLALCYPYDSVSLAAPYLLEKLGYLYAVAGPTRFDRSAHAADASPFGLPRVYPYSGEAIYPAIGGTHGMTFGELILAASAPEYFGPDGPPPTLEVPIDDSLDGLPAPAMP